MKTKTLISSLLLLIMLFVGCKKEIVDDPTKIDLNLKSQQLVQADNDFGLDMFQLIEAEETGNFTISPLSISLALAMTYNGAKEETKAAMEEALRLSGFTTEEINLSYQSLVKALLEADPKVTLEIAQSIWYRQGFNVLQDFKTVNETYYNAEVNELDFNRSDAKDVINGWIEDKTHDKIKDMIESVEPSHVMFLVNAIYFNGEWQSRFEASDTKKMTFTKEDNATTEVDMMYKKDSVNYFSNETFSSIEMPYGKGNFNMVVLLPNEGKNCNDIITELTPENWKSWMSSYFNTDDLNVRMPKFKSEYEIKLNDVLTAMGMGVAFTQNANFSGINNESDLYIDYVQHNTFIDVNEKGTEAAAATVVAIKEYSAIPLEFNVNKPFVYAITEKETGAILFIGKIVDPKY